MVTDSTSLNVHIEKDYYGREIVEHWQCVMSPEAPDKFKLVVTKPGTSSQVYADDSVAHDAVPKEVLDILYEQLSVACDRIDSMRR